jgi:hypothetical protein
LWICCSRSRRQQRQARGCPLAVWKYAVRRRLNSATGGSFALEGSNWFSASPARTWKGDLRLLVNEHRALREAIATYPTEALDSPIDRKKSVRSGAGYIGRSSQYSQLKGDERLYHGAGASQS